MTTNDELLDRRVSRSSAPTVMQERPIHPTVRLDYFLRIPAGILVLLIFGSIYVSRPTPLWVWGLMFFYALAWPHVAYFVARHANDTKSAELRNLLFDMAFVCFQTALSRVSLWPTVATIAAVNAANLSVGGIRFAMKGLAAGTVAFALGFFLNGSQVDLSASPLTTGFAITALVVYMAMFGLYSHIQTKRAVKSRHEVLEQKQQLEEQALVIERARRVADEARQSAEEAKEAAESANHA